MRYQKLINQNITKKHFDRQYWLRKLSPEHQVFITTLMKTAISHYGADNVDIQLYKLKKSDTYFTSAYMIIRFNEVQIKNSNGATMKLNGLYHFTEINLLNLTIGDTYILRSSATTKELLNGYMHSHSPNTYKHTLFNERFWGYGDYSTEELTDNEKSSRLRKCCLGTSFTKQVIDKINNAQMQNDELNENDLKALVLSIKNYVSWESLEGVPHKRLENVLNKKVDIDYSGEEENVTNSFKHIVRKFLSPVHYNIAKDKLKFHQNDVGRFVIVENSIFDYLMVVTDIHKEYGKHIFYYYNRTRATIENITITNHKYSWNPYIIEELNQEDTNLSSLFENEIKMNSILFKSNLIKFRVIDNRNRAVSTFDDISQVSVDEIFLNQKFKHLFINEITKLYILAGTTNSDTYPSREHESQIIQEIDA